MAETKTTTGTTTTTITVTITITATETPATEAPVETPTPATETTIGTLPAPAKTTTEASAETELQEMQAAHEAAVDFCVNLDAEDFCEHIRYAQHFGNKFPVHVAELKNVINADDVYKDAIHKICEPLGKEVTRKAITLVDNKKIFDLTEYLKHVKAIVEEWGEV